MSASSMVDTTPIAIFPDPKDQITSYNSTNSQYVSFLNSLENQFNIPKEQLSLIYDEYLTSFNKAYNHSQISMLPCFKIPKTFNHKTDLNGQFIVLDIGGSTIRIGIVNLSNIHDPIVVQKQWLLDEDSKIIDLGFFENLVDKAIEITTSLGDENDDIKEWEIGMTWSFPVNESNEIITMGKGFCITQEVVGIGIDKIVQRVCFARHFNAKVSSVINDSIAVNLSGLIDCDFNSKISFILGTGLNSCVIRNHELINTELGFFGKLHNVTKYDLIIDQRWTSMKKPYIENAPDGVKIFQPLEFLASGRYLSEMLRLIIMDLIQRDLLPNFQVKNFIEPFQLHGKFICIFGSSNNNSLIKSEMSSQYNIIITDEEITILRHVIDIILERSSIYVSIAIKALSQFVNDEEDIINVNYIGSFLSHCTDLQAKISKHSQHTIKLNHIDNSSILGAAVASCIKGHK